MSGALLLLSTRLACSPNGYEPTGLDGGMARLSGVVERVAGEPAWRTDVYLVRDREGVERTTTDADGRFQFEAVPPGRYEVFAHGGVRGGALQSAVLYPTGENVIGLILAPMQNHPELVTYRNIGLETRLTDSPGDLQMDILAFHTGREPEPGRAFFSRTQGSVRSILDVDLLTGQEQLIAGISTEETLLAGQFILTPVESDTYSETIAIRRIGSDEELGRIHATYGSRPDPFRIGIAGWYHRASDGSVLALDKVNERAFAPVGNFFDSWEAYDDRVAVLSQSGVRFSEPLAGWETSLGIRVLAVHDTALYYAPGTQCDEARCGIAPVDDAIPIRRLDLQTLQTSDVATLSLDPRRLVFRQRGDSYLLLWDDYPDASSGLFSLHLESGEVTELPPPSPMPYPRYFWATENELVWRSNEQFWYRRKNSVSRQLPGNELAGKAGLNGRYSARSPVISDNYFFGLWMVNKDEDSFEGSLGAVSVVDLATDQYRSIEFNSEDGGHPTCKDVCGKELHPEGRTLIWDYAFFDSELVDDSLAMVFGLEPTDAPRVWRCPATGWPPWKIGVDRRYEALIRVLANGNHQVFLGGAGAPISSFRQVSFMAGRNPIIVHVGTEDQSGFVSYLGQDNLSGYRQLFRAEFGGQS